MKFLIQAVSNAATLPNPEEERICLSVDDPSHHHTVNSHRVSQHINHTFKMHSPSRSREYDAESDSWDGSGRHKWDAFEIRTLVCLIIKEEHRLSPDPMDFATKMSTSSKSLFLRS